MKVQTDITINAPIEKVYEVFSDITKIEGRIEGIQKVEILSDKTGGVGVKWRETRVMFGKEATEEMEMTSATPPTGYVVEAESRGTHYHSEYKFTKLNDSQTEVTLVFEGRPVSFGAKLLSPLGAMMMGSVRKAFDKDLAELKAFLEAS